MFISSKFKAKPIAIPAEFSGIELVCVDISFGYTVFRIIGYYRPPGFDTDDCLYASSSVKALAFLYSTRHLCMLLGDFNLPDID